MIAQVCNVLVPFLAFLKSYIYALKANNMLAIMLDPQFKNMKIIHGFVCNCVVVQIVAKYDIKLVYLFLIYTYFYLNLMKTSMEAINNEDDHTFFGQIVSNDVAIILVLNNELTLIISYQQSNVGLAKTKNPLLRWAKHETQFAHVFFFVHRVFGIVGSQIKIK
jgi:hypothetical protein